ncbi:MAG: heavy-metal-associated domain-containing protein [Tepidisphaeraceae bacterium]
MQKVLMIMGVLSMFGFGVTTTPQKEQQPATGSGVTLKVKGMSCSACAARVEKAAKEVAGVKAAKVDSNKGTAEITYDAEKTTPAAIAAAINKKTPFKTEVPPADKR